MLFEHTYLLELLPFLLMIGGLVTLALVFITSKN